MSSNNFTPFVGTDTADAATLNNKLGQLDAAIGVDTVAAAAPTVNDDETADHRVGNTWYDTTTGDIWIAKDVTTGAAVWEVINTEPSPSFSTLTLDGSGNVTISTGSYYEIDSNGAAAQDQVVNINGGSTGDTIFLKAADAAHNVVLQDGSGNIVTRSGGDTELSTTAVVECLYDGSSWLVMDEGTLGEIKVTMVEVRPLNYVLLDAQAISRTHYKALFDEFGTTYGVGDGSTTFALPDGRGNVFGGMDDYGATLSGEGARNKVTDANADSIGGETGAETHTLTSSEMPSHKHGTSTIALYPDGSGAGNQASESAGGSPVGSTGGADTGNTGGGSAHNNMQPTMFGFVWVRF